MSSSQLERHRVVSREAYDVLGVTFLVESTTHEIAEAVGRLLAGFEVATGAEVPPARRLLLLNNSESGQYQLFRDNSVLCGSHQLGAVLNHLVSAINVKALTGFTGFAAHAGVVAFSGNAIAYLAQSGGGKSTLVAASLAEGFQYVSDEALCLDFASKSVLPYPKPLQLSVESLRALGMPCQGTPGRDEESVSYAELGGSLASAPLELAQVVRLVRTGGRAEIVATPSVEGVEWLLERSFNHYKRPFDSFLLVTEFVSRCRVWQLRYEHAREAAALVAEHLALVRRPLNS